MSDRPESETRVTDIETIREALELAQRLDGMGQSRFAARWSDAKAALDRLRADLATREAEVAAATRFLAEMGIALNALRAALKQTARAAPAGEGEE